ncbi:MAG: hypothetical protein ACHP7N_09080 [Caulobacterales bacterium]
MVNSLSRSRYEAACAFVEREGRPLDAALLARKQGNASADEVLSALSAFQNADGGFGHGLEPDTQSPASTAIATSLGLRLLRGTGAVAGHPMVRAAIDWLGETIDPDRGVWPIVPREVELAPHAPWWGWSEDLAQSWNGFRFNPTAEILGLLYGWRERTEPALLAAAEAGMRLTLSETTLIEGAYDLKCAVRLAETPAAPADLRQPLADLVRRSVAAHDPADEHASALELAPRPDSLVADLVADRLDAAVSALIEGQQADGGWIPFWDWSFVDATAWAKAKQDWRGWLTREALELLQAHGRVESP